MTVIVRKGAANMACPMPYMMGLRKNLIIQSFSASLLFSDPSQNLAGQPGPAWGCRGRPGSRAASQMFSNNIRPTILLQVQRLDPTNVILERQWLRKRSKLELLKIVLKAIKCSHDTNKLRDLWGLVC